MRRPSRRDFGKAAAAAGLATALSARRAYGANERIRVGFIGVGNRGDQVLDGFLPHQDAQVVAVCDADSNIIGDAMTAVEKKTGQKPAYVQDLRKVMDDKSIDLVSIAMPNHWHVLASIWAIQAGKDVYVEKPLGHNIWEQRKLVEASRKHDKIVQMGNYTRSLESHRRAIEFLRSGKLGKVKVVHSIVYGTRGSIRKLADAPVPAGVDYNLWMGPAAERPFNPNRFHYNWHWNFEYGGGEIANNGVYYLDVARWGLGKNEHPKRAMSLGGRLGYEDDGNTPNSQIGVLDYGDVQIIQEIRGLPTDKYMDITSGNVFHCAEGSLVIGGKTIAAFTPKGELIQKFSGGGEHFRNFADAVKARKRDLLNSEVLEGHLSTVLCHLPNVSYRLGETKLVSGDAPFEKSDGGNDAWNRMAAHLKESEIDLSKVPLRVGRTLNFDGKTETFTSDDEANKLLAREYRKPFTVPENI